MASSAQDKAKTFVQAVSDHHESLKQANGTSAAASPQIMATNLSQFVERLLAKQEEFKAMNVCSQIDIGFHWTQIGHVHSIDTHGLLTLQERIAKGIQSKFNGSGWGDGIYTSDDHRQCSNQAYGPVCLLVARLKGVTSADPNLLSATYAQAPYVVLRCSDQCVPILRFDATPDAIIHQYQAGIHNLIDAHLNRVKSQASIDKCLYYTAPEVLNDGALDKIIMIPDTPKHLTDDCVICLHALGTKEIGQIEGCGHRFHWACIIEATSYSTRCPLCTTAIVEPQGKMPSGQMTVQRRRDMTCEGYGPGSIQIDYRLDGGVQKLYHGNPGVAFQGTTRTAYLPDTTEGLLLLKRLEYAFNHGLTFTVGTSVTQGTPNVVTWTSIHHKTSPTGGTASYGFPDDGYFFNCNEELDNLGVPSADLL
ncbi:E3 ubiquitin-protein ligase dtx3l [Mayamaea pseudoterrestris]|nr:E3 ubiquitin-protein ligase dtx3l [Mayamaea pseudoterrestris]